MKHRLKRCKIILLIPLLVSLVYATPVLATEQPDTTPVISEFYANVYVIEEDDVVIYGLYNLPYSSLPDEDAEDTYIFRLIDTDNTTQLGVITPFVQFDSGYNEGVFGFYFDADDALTIDQNYIIRISQNPAFFDDPQSYDYVMPLSAWTSETTNLGNQAEVTINIISIAEELEDAHDETLLESSVGGTVLSDPTGETYFRGAIYGIQAMAPDLFLVQTLGWDTEDSGWTTDKFDEYGTRFSGTFIGTSTDNTSATFGLDTQTLMSLIFALPIIVGTAIVCQIKFRKIEPSYMVAALVLILVALMGWIDPALFALVYQLFAMYIGYLCFYARSGDTFGSRTLSFMAFTWLMSTLICLVVEGSWVGTAEQTIINDLSAFTVLKIGGMVPIPAPNLYFFRGIFRLLLWDYSFYTGDFEIVRYIWLVVFTGAAVFELFKNSAAVFANFLRIR